MSSPSTGPATACSTLAVSYAASFHLMSDIEACRTASRMKAAIRSCLAGPLVLFGVARRRASRSSRSLIARGIRKADTRFWRRSDRRSEALWRSTRRGTTPLRGPGSCRGKLYRSRASGARPEALCTEAPRYVASAPLSQVLSGRAVRMSADTKRERTVALRPLCSLTSSTSRSRESWSGTGSGTTETRAGDSESNAARGTLTAGSTMRLMT